MPKIEDELKSSDNLLKQVRQIVSAQFFALTKVQQNVTISLVREILQRIDPKGFNLGFSDENEVQLYRKVANGNLYLLVDEYGGIALNFVGRPGKGTSSLYIDDEDVDTRKIIQVAYKFTRLT